MSELILHDKFTMPDGSKRQHVYTLDGNIVAGLSDIMDSAGFGSPWVDRFKRASTFGIALHAAIKYDLTETLGEIDEEEQFQNAFNAYKQYRIDTGLKPIYDMELKRHVMIDEPIYSEREHFACTPDLLCVIRHRYSLIDWKSGEYDKNVTPVKTVAYEDVIREKMNLEEHVKIDALVVQLLCDTPEPGKKPYIVHKMNNPLARTTWQSAKNIWRWKNRKG